MSVATNDKIVTYGGLGAFKTKMVSAAREMSARYGTCSTTAAGAAKTVACADFALEVGARIAVKFTYANTNTAPTLNVNSTGAKAMYYNDTRIANNDIIVAGGIYDFVYTGTYYQLLSADTLVSSSGNTSNIDVEIEGSTGIESTTMYTVTTNSGLINLWVE